MWVWSKGLGQMVMPLNLKQVKILAEKEKLVVKGQIVAPKVNWDYTITLREQDLVDFMKLLNERKVVEYLAHEGWIRHLGGLFMRALLVGLLYFWCEGKRIWSSSQQG